MDQLMEALAGEFSPATVQAFVELHFTLTSLSLLVCHGCGLRGWSRFTGCSMTRHFRQHWPHIPVYAGDFLYHSPFDTGVSPWYGSACHAGQPLACMNFAALFLLAQSVPAMCSSVHGESVTWKSHLPALQQYSAVPSLWLVQQPLMGFPFAMRHLPCSACSQFYHLLKIAFFCLALVEKIKDHLANQIVPQASAVQSTATCNSLAGFKWPARAR